MNVQFIRPNEIPEGRHHTETADVRSHHILLDLRTSFALELLSQRAGTMYARRMKVASKFDHVEREEKMGVGAMANSECGDGPEVQLRLLCMLLHRERGSKICCQSGASSRSH